MTNEKPILFSTEMVKSILSGFKSQTRRVVKCEYNEIRWNPIVLNGYGGWCDEHGNPVNCPYGQVGDVLWVRETWCRWYNGHGYYYKADKLYPDNSGGMVGRPIDYDEGAVPWKPSIHMPRAACRIRLEITDIRVERLQDISWEDAVAEGCPGYRPTQDEPTHQFQRLWTKINGEESWQSNPWVWVISFHPLKNRHNGRE
jgi:hypothetical protein